MVVLSLVIVRHGRTNANDNKIIQGHAPEPLNDVGRREVDLLAKRLSKIEFTNVFSSDLVRAKDTTKILLESINFDKNNVFYDERLRERKFGVLEGQSVKLRTKLAAEAKQPILAYTPQDGETFGDLQDRAAKFFEFIREKLYEELCDCKGMTYDPAIKENLIRTENQGYAAGFTSGVKIATALGREIGFYEGFAHANLHKISKSLPDEKSRRQQKILEKVVTICDELRLEPETEECLRSVEFLRKLMKQVLPQEELPPVGKTEAMNF